MMRGFAVALLFFCLAPPLYAQEAGPPNVLVEANLYPYLDPVSTDTDFTLLVNARLPARFSYFSYQNFTGVVSSGEPQFFRSEQNLRWTIREGLPIDLNAQGILVDGDGNDIFQLGIGFRLHDVAFFEPIFRRLNLIYRVTFNLKRFSSGDNDAWQMEHFFRMTFPGISKRLYLSGFLDQNFDLDVPAALPDQPIVTEIQAGIRLFRDLYAVAEYRRNDFRAGTEENLALGIEYKFRW